MEGLTLLGFTYQVVGEAVRVVELVRAVRVVEKRETENEEVRVHGLSCREGMVVLWLGEVGG